MVVSEMTYTVLSGMSTIPYHLAIMQNNAYQISITSKELEWQ